ncbi:MAG: 4a-hydroxytetrahydrobiopterin dehydratase [Parcubacteria group bacterium Gr01-1014_8]|nr:MAG: 4a-hydroxytetrahydrobiopterin dehydratase [Parcubacteria group bacterium Gr01-1014_8]
MTLLQKKCIPCEVGAVPLTRDEAETLRKQTPEWRLSDDAKKMSRSFKLKDFKEALAFVNKIGEIAEAEGHHPDIVLKWGGVGVELSTHSMHGLSENDFILAAKIDGIE